MPNTSQAVEAAVEQFRRVLEGQIARQRRMEEGAAAVDFTKKERIVIGVAGGDGIGPILVEQAARVLRHPAKQAGFVELAVCTAAGTREARRVSKKQGAAFRMARKAEAGDELEG